MALLPEPRQLNPSMWKTCTGASVKIPPAGSVVFYFPEGHAEQASSTPELPACRPFHVLSRVLSVKLLADPATDEAFARLALVPISPADAVDGGGNGGGGEEEVSRVVEAFGKTLTLSDANNGGGFSVPRSCADNVFPKLNYKDETPVDNIHVSDVHGRMWEFRHIFRGTPRRHLLTTGWSKFVNSKKLVSGDSVIFMRDSANNLFVGLRRTGRFANGGGGAVAEVEGGFSRCSRGRVRAAAVVEAVERAMSGREFEVEYYPRAGAAEFVVQAAAVKEALSVVWESGIQVKMLVDSEETGKPETIEGKIQAVCSSDGSPWRMLEVKWDNAKGSPKVSPWQVELASHLQPAFPPMKKGRIYPSGEFEFLSNGNGLESVPVPSNELMQHITPSCFFYNNFPAGMQGARHVHDVLSVQNLSNSLSDNHQVLQPFHLYPMGSSLALSGMDANLQMKNPSQVRNSSPQNQGRAHILEADLHGCENSDSSAKSIGDTFQLFGQTIQMNGNGECKADGVGSNCDETDVAGGTLHLPISSKSVSPLYKTLDPTVERYYPLK